MLIRGLIKPARWIERLGIGAPECLRAIYTLDRECHYCAFAHEHLVDVLPVRALDWGTEGKDVVFRGLVIS